MALTKVKTVKVWPIKGDMPPRYRKLPMVLLAAIRNVYGQPYNVEHIEAGHYRMETRLLKLDYTVPRPDGRVCLMRAYRKEAFRGLPDREPFCVAQYRLGEK